MCTLHSLCSLLAYSCQDICGLSHANIWLQEAQCKFFPGLHWSTNRGGSGNKLIWYHHVRWLTFWSLYILLLCNSTEIVLKCCFSVIIQFQLCGESLSRQEASFSWSLQCAQGVLLLMWLWLLLSVKSHKTTRMHQKGNNIFNSESINVLFCIVFWNSLSSFRMVVSCTSVTFTAVGD